MFIRESVIRRYAFLLADIVCIVISLALANYLRFGRIDLRQFDDVFLRSMSAAVVMACLAYMLSIYAMPAVMASDTGSSDAAKTAINTFIVILLNLALGIGIMMLAHGLFVLLLGHAQEQSPEQSRSIREIAVGIVLIMLRVILAGVDFAGMFTTVTSFGG